MTAPATTAAPDTAVSDTAAPDTPASGTVAVGPARREHDGHARRFVEQMARRCASENKADRAALRSGLRRTPDQVPRMHRIVAPFLPDNPNLSVERAFYTVASLIAAHGDGPSRPGLSLGGALAGVPGISTDSLDKLLLVLARQDADGIHRQAVRASDLIASKKAPRPDWAVLLDDLARWPSEGRTARRWLQQYHQARFRQDRD